MNDVLNRAAELRRLAEEKAAADKHPEEALGFEEAHRLNHELRVHQIELEMQNDELRRAQREIEESRARYFDLYDLAPVAYFTIDRSGVILEANLTGARLLAVERITLPRQHLGRFVVKEDHDSYYLLIKKLFDTGSPQVCEIKIISRADVVLDVRMQATLAENDGVRVARIILVDVTESRRAEVALHESEARLRAISEASFDGIIIHGDGKIIEVNEAFGDMYGYAVSELIGKPLLDLYVPESRAVIRHHVDTGLENPYEVTAIRKNGSRFIAEVRGRNAIYKGKAVRGGTHRDITERRRAEEELKASREALRLANEGLEDKVKKRSHKLLKTVRKLEKEIERRSQVEEELTRRAVQLRALAGELTMAEQRERKRLSNILHDHVQQLMAATKLQVGSLRENGRDDHPAITEIENLLDDTIKITRSLSAELSPPILHEGGLKSGLNWLARWMLQKHGLTVDIDSPKDYYPLAEDVRILLFEAARELLFNAVKHSGVQNVKVSIKDEENFLKVAVIDHGHGFDPTSQKQPGENGTGFGLFSIRERIELIGGTFTIESFLGKRSCFTLTVPLIATAASPQTELRASARREMQVEAAHDRIRLLLVDDHAVVREGLARLLGQEPDIQIVAQASDGLEAVDLADQFLPDVILMDFSMPNMNGIEATKAITQRHPQIQVIGLSVYDQEERAKEMLDAGAVNYLNKSGPATAVKAAIRAARFPIRG